MIRSRLFAALAFVLALWIGIGSVASSVLASEMALKMALSDQAADTENELCPACDGNAIGKGVSDCLHFCSFVQVAVFPPSLAPQIAMKPKFVLSPGPVLYETISGIEPSPPKPSIIR